MSTYTVAIVTGSAGGLGKEFAQRLLQQGTKVTLSDINAELGLETLKELAQTFGQDKVHFVKADVSSQSDWQHLWQETLDKFEVTQVDLLVNNAGVTGDDVKWKLCLDINLKGVLLGTTLALEKMGPTGTVVNVASILGLFCSKLPNSWPYCVSKCGVVVASRGISYSTNSKVKILCLCPSVTNTPILQQYSKQELDRMAKSVRGFLEPEQVGDAFVSLINDASAPSGSVMAVWNNCPSYYVPDVSKSLFVFFTTCAMAFSYILDRKQILSWPHYLAAAFIFLLISLVPFAILAFFMSSLF